MHQTKTESTRLRIIKQTLSEIACAGKEDYKVWVPEQNNLESTGNLEQPELGVIDLHAFRPEDVKDVVLDYLELCRESGICEVRIIHGKGIGQLRNTVRSILSKHPDVIYFALATEHYGGSGATIVHLKPK